MVRKGPGLQSGFPEPPLIFAGFGAKAFAFFNDLAAEQTLDWFEAHKAIYEDEVRTPMAALLEALTLECARRDIPLKADPKRSVFRVHRDVRFSKDKRPYKTHIGATLTRSGAKMAPGVLYIHIDPKGSFAASGFFRPEPDVLDALRERIASKPSAYRHAVEALVESKLILLPDDEALKRLPRGYERFGSERIGDEDLQEALRRKSFIVRLPLMQSDVGDASLISMLGDFTERVQPLLEFGWDALAG